MAYSGHLENGSEVLYLAEVAILVFNDFEMSRHIDKERNVNLLGLKE
jgi:predicted DNA-binding protein with PD1-like motif